MGYWSTVEAEKTLRVPSALSSTRPYHERRDAMGRRVAQVGGHGVPPARGLHAAEAVGHGGERLLPARRPQLAVRAAHERRAQAVGIVVQVGQRDPFRAQEAAREDVLGVPADLR